MFGGSIRLYLSPHLAVGSCLHVRAMYLARQAYAVIADMTINKLPSGKKVVGLVEPHLRQHWLGQQEHLKKMVAGLLGVKAVQSAIVWWWEFLVDLLKTNAKQPPNSARALEYEKARREKRLEKQREFSHESTIVHEAIKLEVDQRRVCHSLTSFFGAIDEVSRARTPRSKDVSACWVG